MQGYEEFNEKQLKILEKYVTNTSSNIFVLRNLPEVIKGALFSRYSRSSLGLRSLLLKEFILGEETSFKTIVGHSSDFEQQNPEDQVSAIKKAQNFYDRILDGYGDDSIGELGGAHLAIENVSMIAAKILEDSRIGGSPLEKSTRYIYFDQKVNDQYLYYREPILMTSAYKELYQSTCDMLFETYSKLIPPMTDYMEKRFPKEPDSSKAAYAAALRAKVLDCLRGILPAGTLTNMGIYGNGRFWEGIIHKLQCQNLVELQEIGKQAFEELTKVIPSFVRRSDLHHRHHEAYSRFYESMQAELKNVASHHTLPESTSEPGVTLIAYDTDSVAKVAASLLYGTGNYSLEDLQRYCHKLPGEELAKIFDAASSMRENRRHKSPRALEHAQFTFEIIGDFGIYRDLHRHRILTQERQLLTCDYGYYIPPEILNTQMEKPYREAMERAKEAHARIAQDLAEEAQYLVPMAFHVRWYFNLNLRALQWITELRSSAAGHPNYRYIAQEMAKQVISVFPGFESFLKFVDYDGYELGRLDQEQRKIDKMEGR
jgi:thymidylate synthase ThyX